MGAQSNGAALTETRGDPAAAGTHLFVGVDIGRFYHLVAAIPQRMENGSWERAVARRFATSADGFEELVAWLHSFDVSVDDIRVGLEPTGGLYSRTVVAWLVRHGFQVDWLQNWAVHDRRHLLIGKQAKSDALDARLIARLLYERECLGLVGAVPPSDADGGRGTANAGPQPVQAALLAHPPPAPARGARGCALPRIQGGVPSTLSIGEELHEGGSGRFSRVRILSSHSVRNIRRSTCPHTGST